MSARLIGELAEWLRTPAAEDLTPPERLVLFVIAERCHEATRIMLRHRGDDAQLIDRLAQAVGLDRDGGLKRALQKLAKRGLEVRVPVKEGKDGRPVFTYEGHSMEFRLPKFPASVELPRGGHLCTASHPPGPVDNPVDNPPPGGSPGTPEAGTSVPPLTPEAGTSVPPLTPEAVQSCTALSPSTTSLLEEHPPVVRSSLAEEEAPPPEPADDPKNKTFNFDFRSACAFLLSIPGDLQATAITTAQHQLPDAENEAIKIRAAQIAAKGVPA